MRETLKGGGVSLFKRTVPDIGVVLFLGFLCGLFFWRIITPDLADRRFFPSGDFSDQFYAFSLFAARELRSGRLPLWNPYAFSGHPFLADVQSAVFYPLRLLTILLSASFAFYALELETVSHFFLASLFTYLFACRLLGKKYAALVCALTFTYGGYLTSYPPLQLAILETDVWLPLLLLLLDIAWDRWQKGDRWSYFVLPGVALGLALLAGHPQSSMYLIYGSAMYFAFRAYRSHTPVLQRALLLGIVLSLGFGLAAVQLVPGWEYMRLSTRAEGSYQTMAHGFPPHDLLHIVLPGSLATWSPLYVGILPLILAILALCLWRREVIFWGFLALLALLLSLGGATFLYSPFYLLVPGFGLFRCQERIAFLFSFAVAILAGYGALSLIKPLSRMARSRLRAFSKALLLAMVGTIALAFLFLYGWLGKGRAHPKPFGHMLNRTILLGIFVAFSWGIIQLRLRGGRRRVVLLSLILFTTIFDLFTINWRTNLQREDPIIGCDSQPLLAPMLVDGGLFRAYNEGALPGNYGLPCKIEDTQGASPLRLKRYEEFITTLPLERVWRLLNVKYVVSWREMLPIPSELLYQEEVTYLHRLLDPSAHAYIVHEVRVVRDDEVWGWLADPDFDPSRTALLTEEVELSLPEVPQWGSSVRIIERGATTIVLEVDAVANGLLVLSEVYYPGWQVYIDGQEGKIYRANYILRAVPLEEGRHRVRLVFAPLSFKIGAGISVFTLMAILLIVSVPRVGRRG